MFLINAISALFRILTAQMQFMRQCLHSEHLRAILSTGSVYWTPRWRFLDRGCIWALVWRFLDRGRILNTLQHFLDMGSHLRSCVAFPWQGLHSEHRTAFLRQGSHLRDCVAFPRQGSHSEHIDFSHVFVYFIDLFADFTFTLLMRRAFCMWFFRNV